MMTAEKDITDRIEAKAQSDFDKLQEIGRNAYASIESMIDALLCDYDRLEELTDEREALVDDLETAEDQDKAEAAKALASWDEVDGEELTALKALAGDCKSEDEARERIQKDDLSIEVRSGWTPLGDTLTADEFMILLSTGGPATRIVGELDENGEPYRAWLEAQDWFQPWTRYFNAEQDVLLAYAQCFYFGE